MREAPLPPGFEGLYGKVRFVHRSTATEYSSSCPQCGGDIHRNGEWPDRFRMFIVGKTRGWCRRCGYVWFPDIDDRNWKPDPEQMRQWQEERERQYQQQKETAEHALMLLEKERKWLEWHDSMDDAARKMWVERGIPDSWQDYWKLGYVCNRAFSHADEFFESDALTIPKFDFGWRLRNIDFRIQNPPPKVGRYRPIANLPAAAYITTPDDKGLRDEVFVVEGSVKAMVVAIYTGDKIKQVIGLPACNSWAGMEQKLRDCGRVWIMLDPDATQHAEQLAKEIGKNARVVNLQQKPDDAILRYGMSVSSFNQHLRQATKVN